uniref:Ig-like domain-containing protein n=1 Tax=Oncorhynchus tshawytscha TaxID=74940 RepID=A0A8C8I7X8_ONCTS
MILFNVTQCNNVPRHFQVQRVQIGDQVILNCVFSKQVYNEGNMFWFKQVTGQIPQVVAKMQKNQSRPELHKEFRNSHLSMEKAQADGIYRLTIQKMEPTDEAVYYCVYITECEVNFINGTFLVLKGNRSDYKTVVQRSVSDPFHPGENVTLQCTVLSEACTGEHSVYWFRIGSGESHPGVIYTPGNRRDECQKSPETPSPTQSCVYSLSKNNLSPPDAGTYYCAVAICGEILFGKGTELDLASNTEVNVSGTFEKILESFCFGDKMFSTDSWQT